MHLNIPTKVSELENDENYLTSFTESDPTVPSHVKSISEENISSWNNKAETEAIPTKMSQLTNDIVIECDSEENAKSLSTQNANNFYFTVESDDGSSSKPSQPAPSVT